MGEMDQFLLALLFALVAIGLWAHDHEAEQRRRQEHCIHYHTHVIRVRDMRGSITGTPVKKCMSCGLHWPVYPSWLDWKRYKQEFDQETRDRQIQYERHRQYHEGKAREQRINS